MNGPYLTAFNALFSTNKYQLPMSPNQEQLNKFLEMIGFVHDAATKKYDAYGWEVDHFTKDSTFENCMSAIFRHLFAIHNGEIIDPEDKYPHFWHIACRWQMATTVLFRIIQESEKTPLIITDCGINPQINTKFLDPSMRYLKFITPETIYTLSHVALATVESDIREFKDNHYSFQEVARILSIELLDFWSKYTCHMTNYSVVAERYFLFTNLLICCCLYMEQLYREGIEKELTKIDESVDCPIKTFKV